MELQAHGVPKRGVTAMIAMIRRSVVCHLKKNLFRRYHKFPQTKPRLDGLALAGLDTRPGQSPHEARYLAWLGLAYFGLALAGSRPQAGPGKTLLMILRGMRSMSLKMAGTIYNSRIVLHIVPI